MIKKVFYLSMLALLAVSCQKPPASQNTTTTNTNGSVLTIGSSKITVEIADTDETRRQGLSGRESMDENSGMLFDFRNTSNTKPAFWMKETRFDLDFIWIKNNRVVEITKNVPHPDAGTPETNLPTYKPSQEVDMVLEVNAGYADRNNIHTNDAAT